MEFTTIAFLGLDFNSIKYISEFNRAREATKAGIHAVMLL
jgi:hypothetical protein